MKTPVQHLDYGIYIDQRKAFIVSTNEFEQSEPPLVHIELNIGAVEEEQPRIPSPEKGHAQVLQLKQFAKTVVDRLAEPHRIVVFGPAEEKYELHKEIQRRPALGHAMKEILVSEAMEQPLEAQEFTQHYFSEREPF